jgi:hypothetical protein
MLKMGEILYATFQIYRFQIHSSSTMNATSSKQIMTDIFPSHFQQTKKGFNLATFVCFFFAELQKFKIGKVHENV